MSFKLNLKQLVKLLLITLGLALLLSAWATWAEPHVALQNDSGIDWPVLWQTFSSWLWPLWIIFSAVGYVFMMIYRIVNS